MSRKKREILTGLELGTSTIKVVMAEILADDVLSVIGIGEAASLKVVKGEIADANVVQEQVGRALAAAEKASGQDIGHLFLAITGGHIRTVNSVGSTLVNSPDRKVTEDDIVAAVRIARATSLLPDKKVLHYFDRFYELDSTREVANPVGLVGNKFEADVHIMYGQLNRIETACTLVTDIMGYRPTDLAFSAVADGFAVFSKEEAEKGCLLIDLGAGVTEYIVFHGPGCHHSGQVTIGCEHVTNDLSLALQLPIGRCRKLLHDLAAFGSAVMTPDGRARIMSVETRPLGQSMRRIPISTVEQVIDLRLRELFTVIRDDLTSHRALERVNSGVRLCGGGARIAGIAKLAEHVLQMPVEIAQPRLLSGQQDLVNNPNFITPIGLIRWGKMMLEIAAPPSPPPWQQFCQDVKSLGGLMRRSFRW